MLPATPLLFHKVERIPGVPGDSTPPPLPMVGDVPKSNSFIPLIKVGRYSLNATFKLSIKPEIRLPATSFILSFTSLGNIIQANPAIAALVRNLNISPIRSFLSVIGCTTLFVLSLIAPIPKLFCFSGVRSFNLSAVGLGAASCNALAYILAIFVNLEISLESKFGSTLSSRALSLIIEPETPVGSSFILFRDEKILTKLPTLLLLSSAT